MKDLAIVVGVLALLGLVVWYEVAVWNECRETNSVMYCLRILK